MHWRMNPGRAGHRVRVNKVLRNFPKVARPVNFWPTDI